MFDVQFISRSLLCMFSAAGKAGHMRILLVFIWSTIAGGDWCSLDTGYTTITDGHGFPHSVYISVSRDGSIWMRSGEDHMDMDWMYEDELRHKLQNNLLEQDTVNMLESINYTDYCVVTDVYMAVQARGGWHPSYLVAFDPKLKITTILLFRQNKDIKECYTNTNLTLTRDKQGVFCNGGGRHACGARNLPLRGHGSEALFLKTVNFDPQGPDHWSCGGPQDINMYTFKGSFYHTYVKLASCPSPKDSRVLGHEAKLRPYHDTVANTVLIPDPTQTAINHGLVKGWQVFAKVLSIHHEVYLQVWRPSLELENVFTLVAETFFNPSELLFQEVVLDPADYFHVQRGDVLGLYFPKYNPLGYSSVPCAFEQQKYQYIPNPTEFHVGHTMRFYTSSGGEHPCRYYSFTAIFANKSDAKLIEDWICPTAKAPSGTHRRSGADHKSSSGGKSYDTGSGTQRNPGQKLTETRLSDGTIPIHLVLIIIGCLILLLIIIGSISYYRAMKS